MWNALAEISDSEFMPEEVDIFKNKKNIFKSNILRKEVGKYFANLPEGIIFDILLKVRARHLHENVRLVCKAWKGMISTSNFIAQNSVQMKPKLLIQVSTSSEPLFFKVKVMEVEEEQLDYKLHDFILRRTVRVRSSCNGLVLVSDGSKIGLLEVMNLVTKCSVTLPICPSGCPHKGCGAALAFDPCTKNYKVVHIYADLYGFEIFTLGDSDNEWKRVCGPWKEPSERPFNMDFQWSDPVLIKDRFLHWYVRSDEYIISMDVSTEKPIKTRLPVCGKEIDKNSLLEINGHLSLVYSASNVQIDVWILEDFEGQAWFKKHSILAELTSYTASKDASSCSKQENAFPNLSKLVPLASTRKGEVLMFKHKSYGTDFRFYLYETKRREMKKFKMTIRNVQHFIPHRSTLSHWRTFNKP